MGVFINEEKYFARLKIYPLLFQFTTFSVFKDV